MKKTKNILLSLLMALLVSVLFGTVTMAASDTVAKIGSKSYTSLEAAFKSAKNGDTVVLQKNISYSDVISFNRSGKSVVLNLNKYTITFKKSSYLYIKNGTLTVKNGTVKKTGATYKLVTTTSDIDGDSYTDGTIVGTAIKTAKNGALNITGGTYKGEIYNKGQTTISGGTFTNISSSGTNAYGNKEVLYCTVISNEGTMTITGGAFKSKGGSSWNYATSYMLNNSGTMTISGGSFSATGKTGSFITNTKKLTITGGTFKANSYYAASGDSAIYNGGGTVVIEKGTISNESGCAVMSYMGKVTINGGDFEGVNCITAVGGNITINKGTFNSSGNLIYACGYEYYKNSKYYYGKVTVSGGSFKTTGVKAIILYGGNGGKITVNPHAPPCVAPT